jgi:hypothetical protein
LIKLPSTFTFTRDRYQQQFLKKSNQINRHKRLHRIHLHKLPEPDKVALQLSSSQQHQLHKDDLTQKFWAKIFNLKPKSSSKRIFPRFKARWIIPFQWTYM